MSTEKSTFHVTGRDRPGIKNTITYKFKSTANTSMHIHVGCDEFGVLDSMIINVGSSGTTIHNIVNALGRVISKAIQRDKATALEIVQTLEGMSSEVIWMSDELGRAESIPSVIALVLMRHIDIEESIGDMSSGDWDDEAPMPDEEARNC